MRITSLALVLGLWLGGCETAPEGPPAIELDRTACAHCRMLVSETAYAAAYRGPDGHEKIFDDVGCLVASDPPAGSEIWVHDFVDGGWLPVDEAHLLHESRMETPMGSGIAAFRRRDAAERAVSAYGGAIADSFERLRRRAAERGER